MRILITGGFGFLGGRLAVYLAKVGHQVVLGSRNKVGPPEWLQQAEVVQTEWHDTDVLEYCCRGVDQVIHAAGMNAEDCAADPVAALEFNGLATARLATVAEKVGIKRFIYLSTAHVYASPLEGTITEATCPRNLHPYATSHLAGEHAVLQVARHKGMEEFVLRLSNSFGVPTHKNVKCWMLLVNNLCKQAVQTGKMELMSNGLQHLNITPLRDVCVFFEQFVEKRYGTIPSGVYNLGAQESRTVLEMAKLVQGRCYLVLGYKPPLIIPEIKADKSIVDLVYRCDKLGEIGMGYRVVEYITEIDDLLRFCQAN